MLTDGDGSPMPPVGSKVRFFLFRPGSNTYNNEGIIATYSSDREDKQPTSFTLAAGCRYYKCQSSIKNWVTKDVPMTFKSSLVKHVHGLVVLEPFKGITDDGIKTSESSDFTRFFLTDYLADLQLKCEDQIFHVHRVLLAAASPYFQTMFQNDMTEARAGCIELREIKPKVLKTALKFVYESKIDVKDFKDDSDFSGELLAAAEMYQLENLKKIVEDELCGNLELENVLELVVMGDRHGASKLKEKALKLIVEKKKEVENLDDWR